jgi:HNH endonuclease
VRIPLKREIRAPLELRFLKHISFPASKSGCWEWIGAKGHNGYGLIGLGRAAEGQVRAHRLSHKIFNGGLPKNKLILHRCSNKGCVNPDHLFAGTYRDNLIQAYREGAR